MSVLIRGMDMPKTEEDSKLLILTPDGITELNRMLGEKNPKFAVAEVPQHGRLIDADALWEAVYKMWGLEADPSECSPLMSLIVNAPTIIEAEDRK